MSELVPFQTESKRELDQGVVLLGIPWTEKYRDTPGVVLTARCDFANNKADFVKIATLKPAKDVFGGFKPVREILGEASNGTPLSKKKWDKLKRYLADYIFHRGIFRYYFIDGSRPDFGLWVVDFQHIGSFQADDLSDCDYVGSLNSPDLEHLISHYAAYCGRIGVTRNEDALDGIVSKLVEPVTPPAGLLDTD
jgi:hypothetical protein